MLFTADVLSKLLT